MILDRDVQRCFRRGCNHNARFVPGNVRCNRPISTRRVARGCNLRGGSCMLFLKHVIPRGNIRCLVRTFDGLGAGGGLIVTKNTSSSGRCCRRVRRVTGRSSHIVLAKFVRKRTLGRLCDGTCVCILPDSLRNVPVDLLRTVDCNGYYLASSVPRYTRMIRKRTTAFRRNSIRSLQGGLRRLLRGSSLMRHCGTGTTSCVIDGCG